VGCGTIQPPAPNPDYFSIFDIRRSYFVPALGKKYRSLSRMLHPDRFVRRSAVERRMSLLWTAAINEAKRCLEDPISRARYLATGSAHIQENRRITLSPQFLEHIFDM
jgi:molecular chaperone HscB